MAINIIELPILRTQVVCTLLDCSAHLPVPLACHGTQLLSLSVPGPQRVAVIGELVLIVLLVVNRA